MDSKQIMAIRQLDQLGRIVLPSEYRKRMGWKEEDYIEIAVSTDSKSLTLSKTQAVKKCALCGCEGDKELILATPKRSLCMNCIALIQNLSITKG